MSCRSGPAATDIKSTHQYGEENISETLRLEIVTRTS